MGWPTAHRAAPFSFSQARLLGAQSHDLVVIRRRLNDQSLALAAHVSGGLWGQPPSAATLSTAGC